LANDREDTLKRAEKLLRQGRLDGAIAEYVRLVGDHPRDWATANTLGDLYVRAGQSDKAAAQYARIAEHFLEDGFYPKAAAIYKKILKITPDDEASQMQLAELSVKQGLLADAKSYLAAVAARRRARGDHPGANENVNPLARRRAGRGCRRGRHPLPAGLRRPPRERPGG
jgi:tetratricopeptide (TPR) repeat protein